MTRTLELASAQQASLVATAHRPWPLPERRWLMGQTWDDLLFAHWPVPPERLRPLLPASVPLDVREGSAWVGVTPPSGSRQPGFTACHTSLGSRASRS